MTTTRNKQISKFLSLILRHQPEKIGLQLDDNGWALVTDILSKSPLQFSKEELLTVVKTNDKQRFAFNADQSKIRANQGHSLKNITLDLAPQTPPAFLYHGTVAKFISNIQKQGLLKMNRQHVHLSTDRATATKVGARRGKPVILSIRALDMHQMGHVFYLSNNGVWLTDAVPPQFINFK